MAVFSMFDDTSPGSRQPHIDQGLPAAGGRRLPFTLAAETDCRCTHCRLTTRVPRWSARCPVFVPFSTCSSHCCSKDMCLKRVESQNKHKQTMKLISKNSNMVHSCKAVSLCLAISSSIPDLEVRDPVKFHVSSWRNQKISLMLKSHVFNS